MFVSLNFIITMLTFSHGCNYAIDNVMLINSHHKALTPLLPPYHPLHLLPIILRWVAALFGSSLKMLVACSIVVTACVSRTREWAAAYHECKTRRNQQIFDVLVLHYVILFYFLPHCFLSMFNMKFCEFYWQLFCFKTVAASCSYFTAIFIFDFKHQ